MVTHADPAVAAATRPEGVERPGHEVGSKQQVLGWVAGEHQFGEHHQVAVGCGGTSDGVDHQGHVAVEVTHGGVYLSQGDTQAGHGWQA